MRKDVTLNLPPLENWDAQVFSYGFMLDRTGATDYSGSLQPGGNDLRGVYPAPGDLHILNLNPQQIQVREPIATAISFTQGGGKVIESRGGVIYDYTIRGTTGLLPPKNPSAEHMQARTAQAGLLSFDEDRLTDYDAALLKSTGFYEFYRLRKLFRTFASQRKAGDVVFMHYMDFKGDEFWLIEPTSFEMTRTRFGYNYTIAFRAIEPSDLILVGGDNLNTTGVSSLQTQDLYASFDPTASSLGLQPIPPRIGVNEPWTAMSARQAALMDIAKVFITNGSDVVSSDRLSLDLQNVLNKAAVLQTFLADAASRRDRALATPLGLFRQVASSLTGLSDALLRHTPEAYKRDINEWLVEMTVLNYQMQATWQATYGDTIGDNLLAESEKFSEQRAVGGTRGQVMVEPEGSTGSLAIDPVLGTSGFGLIGNLYQMGSLRSLRTEDVLSGESIFDLARRLLGDINRFVDLVIVNDLQPPYIVPSAGARPPGTLAWGDSIQVPTKDASPTGSSAYKSSSASTFNGTVSTAGTSLELIDNDIPLESGQWRGNEWGGFTLEMLTGSAAGETRVVVSNTVDTLVLSRAWVVNPSPGDEYKLTLVEFSVRRASTPDTEAFGRDILAIFNYDTVISGVTVRLGPNGDFLTVEGMDNFHQALTLKMQTPYGSLPLHPRYGSPGVIGSRLEPNVLAMNTFFARRSLLSDPRVQAVLSPKYSAVGGALRFQANVLPIRTRKPAQFRVAL